jgi:hypothetical protein
VTGESEEVSLVQVGEPEVHLTAGAVRAGTLRRFLGGENGKGDRGQCRADEEHQQQPCGRSEHRTGEKHRQSSPGLHMHGCSREREISRRR